MMKRCGVVAAQVIDKYTNKEEDHAFTVFYSMDDKANKVHVGEPHLVVGFGGQGRHSILPTNVQAVAGDHDFKIVSLTPSVTLRVDVKHGEEEDGTSYYRVMSLFYYLLLMLLICYLCCCCCYCCGCYF